MAKTDHANIRVADAVEAYREYYRSAIVQPYDPDQNTDDFNAWLALHNQLAVVEQRQAAGLYIAKLRRIE